MGDKASYTSHPSTATTTYSPTLTPVTMPDLRLLTSKSNDTLCDLPLKPVQARTPPAAWNIRVSPAIVSLLSGYGHITDGVRPCHETQSGPLLHLSPPPRPKLPKYQSTWALAILLHTLCTLRHLPPLLQSSLQSRPNGPMVMSQVRAHQQQG